MVEKILSRIAKVVVSKTEPNLKETANYQVNDGDIAKLGNLGRIVGGIIETTVMEEDNEVVEVAPGVVRTHLNRERVLTESIPPGPVPQKKA